MDAPNQKTYAQLLEFLNMEVPLAPVPNIRDYDEVDNAKGWQSVDDPATLDRLNAYIGDIRDMQYVNPYYPLNTLWKKLSIIGLNFDLRAIHFNQPQGVVTLPLTQFGGRLGFLDNSGEVKSDDGISNRIPGGISLSIYWQNIRGVYTLDAVIEKNFNL